MHDILISSWIRFSRRAVGIACAASMLMLAACDVPPANMNCTTVGESLECVCKHGFEDCDANLVNGCEVDLLTNPHNCGACGSWCSSKEQCMEGICVCQGAMLQVCGGSGCRDLATDAYHCGACNASVDDGNPCTEDTCVGGVAKHANSPADIPCGAGRVCDGTGVCRCLTGASCPSGFCIDGVCCDTACDQPCMQCNIAGKVGTCLPAPVNADDPDSTIPCVGSSSCNGNGVCKGDVESTCTSNAECLSGHCDNGACGEYVSQPGPLVWEWHADASSTASPEYGFTYVEMFMSTMMATDDGRVRAAGTYVTPLFGMPSGTFDEAHGNQFGYVHDQVGPHPFRFDIDANGQTGTFQCLGLASSGYDKNFGESTSYKEYPNGPRLWRAGGDFGSFFEWWSSFTPWGGPEGKTCYSGTITKSASPSWSLGKTDVCAMQASGFAGDDAGYTWIRNAAGLTQYDPTGQIVSTLPDPFSGIGGEIALGPQSEVYLGGRDPKNIQLAKADASGMLQWSKAVPAPKDLTQYGKNCFAYDIDAVGNILLTFSTVGVVDFGNGPMPSQGEKDLVLAKLDPQGNVTWAKRFGGSGFVAKSCSLRRTASEDFAIIVDFSGLVDLGDGVLSSSAVLAKFDAMGSMVWHADLAMHFPFVVEKQTWALAGHPSGAVFVSGSGVAPYPDYSSLLRDLRFVVAKYGP